jgi:DNA-binding MurR/RpiR family transcriptional regulator
MNRDVLSVITSASKSFSKGQRKISAYILENYDKAAFMTASKLGDTVGVSESTVVRFAADLGYDGYPAMRKALQEMIKYRLTTVQRIAVSKELTDSGDVLSSVLSMDVDRIRATLEEIDREAFSKAVEAIVNSRNIYIMGFRSSAALASFMGFYLNLLFPNVKVVNESSNGEVFEQILRIGEGDLMIAISFPRYSRRAVRAICFAKDKGAEIVGITDAESSLIAQYTNINLYAKSEMLSFVDSIVAPMSLINALIVAAATHADRDLVANFEQLESIWAEYDVYEKAED